MRNKIYKKKILTSRVWKIIISHEFFIYLFVIWILFYIFILKYQYIYKRIKNNIIDNIIKIRIENIFKKLKFQNIATLQKLILQNKFKDNSS